jgi:ATP-binding cassette subfamily F protein 3
MRKAETEAKLANPEIYNDQAALSELNRFYSDIKQKLEKATESWENAMLEVDELQSK